METKHSQDPLALLGQRHQSNCIDPSRAQHGVLLPFNQSPFVIPQVPRSTPYNFHLGMGQHTKSRSQTARGFSMQSARDSKKVRASSNCLFRARSPRLSCHVLTMVPAHMPTKNTNYISGQKQTNARNSSTIPVTSCKKNNGKRTKNDTSRTRTDASEESRFLIYRLRPLGHSVLLIHSHQNERYIPKGEVLVYPHVQWGVFCAENSV